MEEIIEEVVKKCAGCKTNNFTVYGIDKAIYSKWHGNVDFMCHFCLITHFQNEEILKVSTYLRSYDEDDFVCQIHWDGFGNEYMHGDDILNVLEERGYIWRI